jgi:hypothetical protein
VSENYEDGIARQFASKVLRSRAYEIASPELRAKMDEEDRQENIDRQETIKKRSEEFARQRREQATNDFLKVAFGIALGLAVFAAIVYGIIKFVKWAWFN